MTIDYKPKGVCSKSFSIDVEDGIILSINMTGGCDGNLKGLANLLVGMKVADAIPRIENIKCGSRPTSCPDQIAKALKTIQ